jgi:outer membrane immunogenic protein
MKRIFATAILLIVGAVTAIAADLPQPPPPPPMAPAMYVPTTVPVYNWGGIYFGVNAGYQWGGSQWSGPANPPDFNVNGGLVGGTIGANIQLERFVFGAEGDFDWQGLTGASINGNCVNTPPAGNGSACQTQSTWLSTVRGRAGYAWDKVLFYGTAGTAFGNIKAGLASGNQTSATAVGWAAGAGTEVAFSDNWTGRMEYIHVDLTNVPCAACGTTPAFSGINLSENIFRASIDYKFRP